MARPFRTIVPTMTMIFPIFTLCVGAIVWRAARQGLYLTVIVINLIMGNRVASMASMAKKLRNSR